MFKRTLLFAVTAMMSFSVFAQEDGAAKEAEVEPGVVVTNEGLVARCILPLVITSVKWRSRRE